MNLFRKQHILFLSLAIVCLLLIGLLGTCLYLTFSSNTDDATETRFIIPRDATLQSTQDLLLYEGYLSTQQHFIISALFSLHGIQSVEPGGYKLAKHMTPWQISNAIANGPYMKWITVPEGWRKEEIAELLAKELGWDEETKKRWVHEDTARLTDYTEGVYFPDTYLIPKEESPKAIAGRLQTRFEEMFAPYATEALSKNIKWTTLLKIASLIQREASNNEDMPLISGIIWNRLEHNMKLDIDATLQYIRGDTGDGFWAPTSATDKLLDSPYNTYLYKGLPPHPIANPGIAAIKAALHPATTSCFYYLHDTNGVTHCAPTYEQHRKNIETYLK